MKSVKISPAKWHSPGWAAIVVFSGDADALQVTEQVPEEIPVYVRTNPPESVELQKVVGEFDVMEFYAWCASNCVHAVVYSYDFTTITYAIL